MGPKMPSFDEGVPEGVRPDDFANPTLQNVSDDKIDRLFNDPTFRALIKEKLQGI